jgi:hemolysin activation/secretion protein
MMQPASSRGTMTRLRGNHTHLLSRNDIVLCWPPNNGADALSSCDRRLSTGTGQGRTMIRYRTGSGRICILFALVSISLSLFLFPARSFGQSTASSTITAKEFSFDGNTVVSTEELRSLTAPYLEKSLDLPALEKVADSITELYKQKGYTLASAYIPQQTIETGTLQIAILEGRIGELNITGNRYYSTDFIRRHFALLEKDKVVRNVSLERTLLLLNGYPDLKVSTVLEPGSTTGSTNVEAKVTDKRPIHGTLDYNNYGFNRVSRNRFGAGVEVGNALFDGAIFNLNGILGDHPDQLQFVTGSYAMPLGNYGTKVIASGSIGKFDVGAELSALQIRGKIYTYDVSLTHPVIKTRFQSLLLEAGFAGKENRLSVLGTRTGSDQIRMLKLGVNYDRLDLSGRTYLSLYGYQGLGEFLGGMDDNAVLSTRRGADGRFTKANVTAGRIQKVWQDVLLVVRGTGQITTGSVVVIEQMLLGGPDSVRGYQLGERFVDEGYTVTAETRIPILPSLLPSTQGVVFIDHGAGRVRNPQPGERHSSSLTGTGFGIHMELPSYHLRLRCDIGFPIGPTPSGGTIAGDRSPTFYLQATARF